MRVMGMFQKDGDTPLPPRMQARDRESISTSGWLWGWLSSRWVGHVVRQSQACSSAPAPQALARKMLSFEAEGCPEGDGAYVVGWGTTQMPVLCW